MVFLYRLYLKLPFYYGLDCKGRGPGPRERCGIWDIECESGPSNGIGFRNGLLAACCVNNKIYFSILDHIHDMGSAFAYFIHSLNGNPVLRKKNASATSGYNLKPQVIKVKHNLKQGHLVFVLDAYKDGP